MTSTPRVAIVVLNWNGWQATAACVDSVLDLSYENRFLVVVDNGSTDESVAALRARYPGLHVLATGENLGFAGGMNVALEWLGRKEPDYVWLLNNDTRPAREALTPLVAIAEHDPVVGAVGSVLVYDDGTDAVEAWGGGRVSFLSGLARHHRVPVPREDLHYLMGASLFLRWGVARELGFLDDRFFLYWEDTDLCFRLRAAGWNLAVAADSVVHHLAHGSLEFQSPAYDREFTASSVLFFQRHAAVPWPPILISACGRVMRRLLRGRWANASATWQGLRHGLLRPRGSTLIADPEPRQRHPRR